MEAVGMVKKFRVDARLDQCSPVALRTTNSKLINSVGTAAPITATTF
jgi:hypothetical protein